MKVLATRRYPGRALDELDDLEIASLRTLGSVRSEVEALVVANEPVPLDLLPGLRIVANFGVGYDRIDVAACAASGVVVTNTPGVLDAATADLAFALILAARRQIVEGDRFALIAFDDSMESPPFCGDRLVPATDHNRFRATEWLKAVDARGGTELAQPLDRAVTQLTGKRDRVLVLVTDGQVGNEDQILQVLGKRSQGIRIFTLGVDRAADVVGQAHGRTPRGLAWRV